MYGDGVQKPAPLNVLQSSPESCLVVAAWGVISMEDGGKGRSPRRGREGRSPKSEEEEECRRTESESSKAGEGETTNKGGGKNTRDLKNSCDKNNVSSQGAVACLIRNGLSQRGYGGPQRYSRGSVLTSSKSVG